MFGVAPVRMYSSYPFASRNVAALDDLIASSEISPRTMVPVIPAMVATAAWSAAALTCFESIKSLLRNFSTFAHNQEVCNG